MKSLYDWAFCQANWPALRLLSRPVYSAGGWQSIHNQWLQWHKTSIFLWNVDSIILLEFLPHFIPIKLFFSFIKLLHKFFHNFLHGDFYIIKPLFVFNFFCPYGKLYRWYCLIVIYFFTWTGGDYGCVSFAW